ncbi:hypothetical protein TNCV_4328321 [Trichonephila clavipes]|nr:hypothetical protein TNCV_4328321 [Trichonephila clavipes]
MCDQLEAMGKPMEETYQCYQLLKSLPSKFDSIVGNILRWTDEKFKYKDILLELVAEETRIDFRDDLSLQRSQHETFSVQKSKIKCHYCGKFGHVTMEVLLHHSVQLIEDTENIEQVQSYIDIRMGLHLLGLLCQVMSSNIILFELVEETETIHLKTEMT